MAKSKDHNAVAASLEITDVSYGYPGNERNALSDINVSVDAGSISALVGPSGCGKSTLLKAVGGMIVPDIGTVAIGGEDVTEIPMAKRRIGWVPQQYALFEHMDVKSNVSFGLRAQKYSKKDRAERVNEILDLCQMSEFADRAVDELSGGQRQRVAIARALAPYPKMLLLDEPLAALDPQLRGALRSHLRSMIRDAGVTTIMVTHDQEEALAMADHLVVMKNGQLVQAGPPEDVWAHPENSWVATFLGNAAIVPILSRTSAGRCEVVPDLSVPTSGGNGSHLAVRSIDFVAYASDTSDSGAARGQVIDCEFHGDVFSAKVQLDGYSEQQLVVPARSQRTLERGQRVEVVASNERKVPEVN